MRDIEVVLVGPDACISFWSALERIRRVCGLDVCATPRGSLEQVVLGEAGRGRAPLVVADLPATMLEGRARRRWLDALRMWSAQEPCPIVVLYIPPLPADRVAALASAGVDEFIVMTEEEFPRVVQRVLTRVLLPLWVNAFAEPIPSRALPLDLGLAVKGFLLHPEGGSPERSLGERTGRDPEEVRQEFARGGLPSPETVCALGLLYAALQKEREYEGGAMRGCTALVWGPTT
ncbi:MAG: hypothetical protein WD960_10935 [Gemmatimonadota bacterium]